MEGIEPHNALCADVQFYTSCGAWAMLARDHVYSGILIVSMLILSMLLVIPEANAWHADISIDDLIPATSVNTVYVNNSTTLTNNFAILVHNIGSQSMKITWLGLHFDWDPLLDSSMGGRWWGTWIDHEEIVASGTTYQDDWVLFDVPREVSTGYHTATVGIEVADPAAGGDWGTSSRSYFDFSVYVATEPATYSPPSNQSPHSPVLVALAVVLAIAAATVIFFAMDRRKKNVKGTASRQVAPIKAVGDHMYCDNCGSTLLADHPYCPSCGRKRM